MKPAQHFDGQRDGFGRQETVAENGLSQTRHFAVFKDFNQAVRNQAGDLQADGVRSDVNGGEGWHSASVYSAKKKTFPAARWKTRRLMPRLPDSAGSPQPFALPLVKTQVAKRTRKTKTILPPIAAPIPTPGP